MDFEDLFSFPSAKVLKESEVQNLRIFDWRVGPRKDSRSF